MYSCLRPTRVYNKYAGKEILAACGKCEHCRSARSAELSSRIDREMVRIDQLNGTTLFLTLDYDNDHLPIYTMNLSDRVWYSNKFGRYDCEGRPERYYPLSIDEVKEFYRPTKYRKRLAFGHLCKEDVQHFLNLIRMAFKYDYKTGKIDEHIKFRYFLCGEYGPVTFRPHYHLLFWFENGLRTASRDYVSEIFHRCWKVGSVDIRTVTDGAIKGYLSGYVNGFVGLPEVLQSKPLRPFCTFSKAPVIGAYEVDDVEIFAALVSGIVARDNRTSNTASDTDVPLSPSFYRRYFPKCRGFSTEAYDAKLRVYSYVYNYFKDLGITHTPEEVENLCFADISFPVKYVVPEREPDILAGFAYSRPYTPLPKGMTWDFAIQKVKYDMQGFETEEWTYTDKYASLVAYHYCVKFDLTPEEVLRGLELIYTKIMSGSLGNYYENFETQYTL